MEFINQLENQSKIVLPSAVKDAIVAEGFDQKKDFEMLTDTDILSLMQVIRKKILEYSKCGNNPRAIRAREYIERYSTSPQSFEIPFAIINKIKAIRYFCQTSDIASTSTNTRLSNAQPSNADLYNVRKQRKQAQIASKLTNEFKNLFPNESIGREVVVDQNYLAQCPFCFLKLPAVDSRGYYSTISFKNHLKRHLHNFQQTTSSLTTTITTSVPENSPIMTVYSNSLSLNASSSITTSANTTTTAVTVYSRPRMSTRSYPQNDNFTNFLKICIENAKCIDLGYKGNRYGEMVMKLAAFLYIRGGKNLYKFMHLNLKFPELTSLKQFMKRELSMISENCLRFDGLKDYLILNKYPLEISLFEDGTKVIEKVEYNSTNDTLSGLVIPFNDATGLPFVDFHKARTAKWIHDAMKNYAKVSYAQLLLAQPNMRGAKPYLLGVYFTDNKFKAIDVINRLKYIKYELEKRSILMIAFGSDGDSRMMAAQKTLINFGNIQRWNALQLCGNMRATTLATQDTFHILKRLKNLLYDLGRTIKMGNFIVSVNHIIIMYKKYDKSQHRLILNDLDVTDTLNYDCIRKITNERVLQLLSGMEETQGTVMYLKLICCGLKAYIDHETLLCDRVFNAVYLTYFIRLWHQSLNNMNHFITQNCVDGLEMNLLWLLQLIFRGKAQNISEHSSQQCESTFRCVRSFTGVECTQISSTPMDLIHRLHKIELGEKIMFELKELIKFPIIEEREKKIKTTLQESENVNWWNIVEVASKLAIEDALKLGITCHDVQLERIIRPIVLRYDQNESSETFSNQIELPNDLENEADDIDENLVLHEVEFLNQPSDDAFLSIKVGTEERKIKKTQLIWMLENNKIHINSDLRHRFIPRRVITIGSSSNNNDDYWKSEKITKGDNIILKNGDELLLGQVLNFKYLKERNKKSSIYYRDHVEIISSENIGVFLNPLYIIQNNNKIDGESDDYFDVTDYICHVKSHTIFPNEVLYDIIKNFIL
ncbi:hypothetical protein PVAND_003015 [Polypedilum vanderplanki]|uniref:Uncharacterized protein n=1 Tax=Polypedilum vanderplanki TaxID=319348 RepID=A0A9J6BSU3_POLVA|nr:hypothetical protein PVAND_003015 [Polypedilum vanderplanki]